MDRTLILYLHGFTGGPQSSKARALTGRMRERGIAEHLICPQLPAEPNAAVALTEALVTQKLGAGGTASVTVIGSSLGGFYATVLAERHGWRAVLINPVVLAALSLERYLGPQTWMHTGERFELTRAHLAQFGQLQVQAPTRLERYWLLAEQADATLDYRAAQRFYAGARADILPGGDHSFTRWTDYIDPVLAFAGFP